MAWAFNKTLWVPNNPPYVTADQLNRMETGIDAAGKLADDSWQRVASVAAIGASVLFTAIPQTFTHLRVIGMMQSQRAGFSSTGCRFNWNGRNDASYYTDYWLRYGFTAANAMEAARLNASVWGYLGQIPAGTRLSNAHVGMFTWDIPFYRTAGVNRHCVANMSFNDGVTNSGNAMTNNFVGWTDPITVINITDDVGSALGPNSMATLYGAK